MKKILLIGLLIYLTISVYAQKDTEFWFACPNISAGHYDDRLRLCFVTFDEPTTITISQPAANPADYMYFETITYAMEANSLWELPLKSWKSVLETIDGTPLPFGLHITSENEIMAYYANTGDNCEVYTLKGRNALGTDFIVPMQYEYENSQSYGGGSSIEIVATEDNTEVTIEPRVACTVNTESDGKIHIILNKGWSYAVKAAGLNGSDHLHNTRITSNKPIAVNTTDDSAVPGGEDLLGDQILPIEMAGTNYIAVKNGGDTEKVYIFPTQDSTTVTIGANTYLMNLGDKRRYAFSASKRAVSITSDKPIIVFQITSSKTELGGAILPHLDCTGSTEVAFQSIFDDVYVEIITKQENIGSFTVNGSTEIIKTTDFKPVPENPSWYYCRKDVSELTGTIRVKNSSGYFHLGVYDIMGWSCSLAYFSDYKGAQLIASSRQGYYVMGDSLYLELYDAGSYTNITWTKPDGTQVIGNPLIIDNVSLTDAGMYTVMAEHVDGCAVTDEGYVVANIFKPQKSDTLTCSGNTIDLASEGYAPYSWAPTSSSSSTLTITPTISTIYTVTNHQVGQSMVYNGDFQKDTVGFISGYIYGGLGQDAINQYETYTITRNANETNNTLNSIYDHTYNDKHKGRFLLANTSSQAGISIWNKQISVQPNTQYMMSAWCITPKQNSTPAKLRFCINSEIVEDIITTTEKWQLFTYLWNGTPRSTVTISIITDSTNIGGSFVGIDDIGFAPLFPITDTINVHVKTLPIPQILGDPYLCEGSAVLRAEDGYKSYLWSKSDGTHLSDQQEITITEPGIYQVEVLDAEGMCNGSSTIKMAIGATVNVALDNNPVICSDEPNFSLGYQLLSGDVASCSVHYSEKAKSAGFTDTENVSLSDNTLTLDLPLGIKPDIYTAELSFIGQSYCGGKQTISKELKVQYASKLVMEQKWNDVIALYNKGYNGGYNFTAYQWYKNGQLLPDEINSYIYLNNSTLDPNDRYCVLLTRDDGLKLFSCDFIPEIRETNQIPSAVAPSQIFSIPNISGIGVAYFWSTTGWLTSIQPIDDQNSHLQAPDMKGMYILEIVINDINTQHKIIVK